MTAEVHTEHTARTINHATVTVYERRTSFRPQAQLALELVGPPEIVGVRECQHVTLGPARREIARRSGSCAGRCLDHPDAIVVDR